MPKYPPGMEAVLNPRFTRSNGHVSRLPPGVTRKEYMDALENLGKTQDFSDEPMTIEGENPSKGVGDKEIDMSGPPPGFTPEEWAEIAGEDQSNAIDFGGKGGITYDSSKDKGFYDPASEVPPPGLGPSFKERFNKRWGSFNGAPPGMSDQEYAAELGLDNKPSAPAPKRSQSFAKTPPPGLGAGPNVRYEDFSNEPMVFSPPRKPTMKDVLNFDNKGMGSMEDALSNAQKSLGGPPAPGGKKPMSDRDYLMGDMKPVYDRTFQPLFNPSAEERGQADMNSALGDIDEVLGRYGLDKKKKQTPGGMPGGFRQGGL